MFLQYTLGNEENLMRGMAVECEPTGAHLACVSALASIFVVLLCFYWNKAFHHSVWAGLEHKMT